MFSALAVVAEMTLMLLEPAYRTYKTMNVTNDDMQRLFIHWIVYSVFRVVDCWAVHWCPMYSVVKLFTIMWLRTTGSEKLYWSIIQPFLDEHRSAVDSWLNRYGQVIGKEVINVSVLTADFEETKDDYIDEDDNSKIYVEDNVDDVGVKNNDTERDDNKESDTVKSNISDLKDPSVIDRT